MKTVILLFFSVFFSFSQNEDIPKQVYELAAKGNKVFIESHDDNAVVHVQNAIESWGYWKVAQKKEEADFILKVFLRFEGAGVCITNATFIDPKTEDVIYSTPEVTSVKTAKGFDFNTKRSAMRQLVEDIFKTNFK